MTEKGKERNLTKTTHMRGTHVAKSGNIKQVRKKEEMKKGVGAGERVSGEGRGKRGRSKAEKGRGWKESLA